MDVEGFRSRLLGLSWKQLADPALLKNELQPIQSAYASPEDYLDVWTPFLMEEVRASASRTLQQSPQDYEARRVGEMNRLAQNSLRAQVTLPKHVDLEPNALLVLSKFPPAFDDQGVPVSKNRDSTFLCIAESVKPIDEQNCGQEGLDRAVASYLICCVSDRGNSFESLLDSFYLIILGTLNTELRVLRSLDRLRFQSFPVLDVLSNPFILPSLCKSDSTYSCDVDDMKCLNASQIAAVDRSVVSSDPVVLIQGPPGTGKTF
jgi:hypothetical protein